MRNWKKRLACLLAGVLALAVFTGCSALGGLIATVKTSPDEAKALMKEIDPDLKYNDMLEYAAQRVADWLVAEPAALSVSEDRLVRRIPLSANDTMISDTVNDFIADAGGPWLSNNVTIAMTKDNSGWATGYIYIPSQNGAAEALRSYAQDCSEMGAAFIQCGEETYLVVLFR